MPSSRVDLGPCEAVLQRPEAADRVVVLPGMAYSIQAPLLWFAQELALARGAGVLAVADRLRDDAEPFAWARDRARRALDFEPAERQVVVGKSLASAAAGLVAERGLPALWLTPLLDQRPVLDGLARAGAPTLLVGGTADDSWQPSALAPNPRLEVVELAGLDHSLQVPGDPPASVEALAEVVAIVDRYLGAALTT
jgi:alpha-beta hydrolase superfamily lysophospholipase